MKNVNGESQIDMQLSMPALLIGAFENFRTALNDASLPGLRPSHYRVMALIPAEGLKLSELARRADITKPGIGQFIAHLQREGYVVLDRNPADNRSKIVTLTASGVAAADLSRQLIAETEEHWATILGTDRYRELRQTLLELKALSDPEPNKS